MSRIERKALAHIAQAQNLLQEPIQTSLAFGTNKMKLESAPKAPENSTNYLQKLSVEHFKRIVKYLSPKERLIVQESAVSQSLCTVIQTSAEKAKKDIEQAWKDNNTMVLDNDEIFRQACTLYPHMFGYASERLQFDLAKEMYERDPKSILGYEAICRKIYHWIRVEQKSKDGRDLERLKILYKRLNPRIEKGVWYLGDQAHIENTKPKEGSGKDPDDKTLFSWDFVDSLWVREQRRRKLITNIANFDTIVQELHDNKKWKDLWHFLESLCMKSVSIPEMMQLHRNIEVSWDVVCAFAKRVKQVALERLRILADIKQWKLAQEL